MSEQPQWRKKASEFKSDAKIFIDGSFFDAASGKTFDNISPSQNKVIGQIASGDVEDVNRAVASAKKVFDAGTWRDMNPRDKKAIMLRWAQLLGEHREELRALGVRDQTERGFVPAQVDLARRPERPVRHLVEVPERLVLDREQRVRGARDVHFFWKFRFTRLKEKRRPGDPKDPQKKKFFFFIFFTR